MRILWLYGPPAVGKSVTAWELLNAIAAADPATAFVDIDQLGMSCADEVEDPERHVLKGRALAAVAGVFASSGVRTLVVSGVIGPALMEFYADELAPYDPVLARLTAPDDELRRRLSARGVYAEEWSGVEEYARAMESAGLDHPVFTTETGTPAEVAAHVWEEVGGLLSDDSPLSEARSACVSGGAEEDEAVLIGGTTAVGKSTIGWHAFMAAREHEPRSAFVDLRQLGFVGVDGGAVDHGLQAKAVSALWRVFRAHGARILIMNGPVNSSAELSIYRTALEGTPLTATRLTATRAALVERARARLRGEMAPLAGDELIGRPLCAAEAVADAAVGLQNRSGSDEAFPTLDTTRLDPRESAMRVLAYE